jgi:hypothetical protein
MTDAVAPKAVRRSGLPQPNISVLRIGASLAAMAVLLGDAFTMAYVDPYTSRRGRPKAAPDEDLEGRDPGW